MTDIDSIRKTLNKCYGADTVYLMSDVSDAAEDAISIGNTAFDHGLLGIGGFPRGQFLEISGEEKSGKTTLVLHMIAACQEVGLVPLVIDHKAAIASDVDRARRIGVDPDGVILVPIGSSDDALRGTRQAIAKLKKEGVDLAFFWDDMGITPSEAELNPKVDKKTGQEKTKVGAKASSMWRFCRSLAGACYKAGAPMVVTNQLTAYIPKETWLAKYAPTETTSGGGGLRYTARIRINLRSGSKIKKGNRKIAQLVYAETTANAFFEPFKKVTMYLDFRNGYDSTMGSIVMAESQGIVTKSRGKYRMKGSPRGTPHVALGDLDDETIWAIESKLWPWLDGDIDGEEETTEDTEGAEEDDFADGYLNG